MLEQVDERRASVPEFEQLPERVPFSDAARIIGTSRDSLLRAAEESGIHRVRVGGGIRQRRWALLKGDVERLWHLHQ